MQCAYENTCHQSYFRAAPPTLPLPPRTCGILCQPECTNDCHPDGLRSHVLLHESVHVVGVSVSQEGGALLVRVNDQWPPSQGGGPLLVLC